MSQWGHHFKIYLSRLRIRCFLLCLSIVVRRVRNTAANRGQTTKLEGGSERNKTKRRTRLTSAQPSRGLMRLYLLLYEPQTKNTPPKTGWIADYIRYYMLHTLSIEVYISCHQLWFSLPLHITSVPFHVPFSMHRLAAVQLFMVMAGGWFMALLYPPYISLGVPRNWTYIDFFHTHTHTHIKLV